MYIVSYRIEKAVRVDQLALYVLAHHFYIVTNQSVTHSRRYDEVGKKEKEAYEINLQNNMKLGK